MGVAVTWRAIRGANDPKFLVKGFELADCFYAQHRFRIAETRAYPEGYEAAPGVRYRVFDAHGVTDAEVKAGKSAPLVGHFPTFDDAIAFCDWRLV